MPYKNEEVQKIQDSHAKQRAWTYFWGSGAAITMTVLYWIGQLPPAQRSAILSAMQAAINLPK